MQAGHATEDRPLSACAGVGPGSGGPERDRTVEVEGRDAESGGVLDDEAVASLGTPQRPHIFVAAGLRPGGFLKAQTSHSHALKKARSEGGIARDESSSGGERNRVILELLVNKPA